MADQPNDSENQGGSKKSKLKLILIIVLALVIIGGGGAAGALYFLSDNSNSEQSEPVVETTKQDALYTKVRTTNGKPMFVVTLQDEGSSRAHFMQAYVEAKSRDQAVVDALTLHMPLIVARLNNLFAAQRFSDLRTLEGKSLLRAKSTELVQEIMQEKLGKPGIETILFTNFVMQ